MKSEDFLLIKKNFIEINLNETLGDLANYRLPDPCLVDYYKRLANREILINHDIDESLVDYYQQILDWNREDKGKPIEERQKIKVFINSNGGCVNSVNAFISAIKLSKTPVMTIGLGKCYSSGGLLLMAGHKGLRYLLPTCEILIHDGSTGLGGNMSKVMDNLEFTKEVEAKMKRYILDNTNISEELYDKNYRRDWFLFADEAVALGIADKIITDIDEIL